LLRHHRDSIDEDEPFVRRVRAQGMCESVDVLESPVDVLGERPTNDAVDFKRQIAALSRERSRLLARDREHEMRSVALERRSPSEERVEHRAKRPHVGACIDALRFSHKLG
jgi:hypothetical protein